MKPRNIRIACLVGGIVFILGLAAYSSLTPFAEYRCSYSPDAQFRNTEGTSSRLEPSFWPPGTRCLYDHPFYSDRPGYETVVVPVSVGQWISLTVMAVLAALFAVGTAAVLRKMRGRRSPGSRRSLG